MPDWDAEGLLDPLTDEGDRQARRELLDELYADRFSLEELQRAVHEDRLVLLPVERALGDGRPKYSLTELVERSGATRELAEANLRAAGVPMPRDEDVVFDDADLENLKRVKSLVDTGLPEEPVFDLIRSVSTGMARIADATRTVIGESLLRPGDTELDLAQRYTAAAKGLAPLSGPALEYAFKYHLREAIRNDVVGGRAAVWAPAATSRWRSPTSSASPAWARSSRPRRSAASSTGWASSPPKSRSARCSSSSSSATRRCSCRPRPSRCSTPPSSSCRPASNRARASLRCARGSPPALP
jgi:hypothetical protein